MVFLGWQMGAIPFMGERKNVSAGPGVDKSFFIHSQALYERQLWERAGRPPMAMPMDRSGAPFTIRHKGIRDRTSAGHTLPRTKFPLGPLAEKVSRYGFGAVVYSSQVHDGE